MERREIIPSIVYTVKNLEPVRYARGAYWEHEQEVGSQKARTRLTHFIIGILTPVGVVSLGVIFHNPWLTAVGGLAESSLVVAAGGEWLKMKLGRPDHIQRVINSPRQPRQLRLIPNS